MRVRLAVALAVALMAAGCGHAAPGAATKPAATPAKTATPAPPSKVPPATPSASAGVLALHLSPASGPPGTTVVISGTAPAGLRPQAAATHATACFASCSAGLKEQALPVDWSAARPGAFTMRLRVPATPWVSAAGVHALAAGTYAIGVRCLVSGLGCGGPGRAEASAPFRLTGPTSAACTHGHPCGTLVLSPPGGPPGTLVHISGWAPLSQVIGQPTGFAIGLRQSGRAAQGLGIAHAHQRFDGDLYGSFVLPPRAPGLGALRKGALAVSAFADFASANRRLVVAQAAFRVQPAPTWAALGRLRPVLIQQAAPGRPTATDPSDPQRVVRCQRPGGIGLSGDGGRTWQSIPTSGVAAALRGTPYTLPGGNRGAGCGTVLLPPGGGTIFATFGGVAHGGGPPFYALPLMTANRGRTWRLLPAPAGYRPSAFSRFQLQGGALQALFWKGPGAATAKFGLEQSTDGGRTWSAGRLACPSAGPCVVWGPAPTWTWPGACNAQAILWSADGGRTWKLPVWPAQVCYVGTGPVGPYELAALAGGRVALLGGSTYPLRLSADGGRTWQAVQVPPLPKQGSNGYPALRLLGDGTLAVPWTGAWYALPPGAAAWCRTATPSRDTLGGDAALRCAG